MARLTPDVQICVFSWHILRYPLLYTGRSLLRGQGVSPGAQPQRGGSVLACPSRAGRDWGGEQGATMAGAQGSGIGWSGSRSACKPSTFLAFLQFCSAPQTRARRGTGLSPPYRPHHAFNGTRHLPRSSSPPPNWASQWLPRWWMVEAKPPPSPSCPPPRAAAGQGWAGITHAPHHRKQMSPGLPMASAPLARRC